MKGKIQSTNCEENLYKHMEKISTRKIGRNLGLSLLAQVVSLVTSFVLGFIVPKFIDEYQYSYWQTYLLYISYVSLLQFGVLDGLVLRYSQYDDDELDKPRIRSQLQMLLTILTVIAAGVILFAFLVLDGVAKYVTVLVALSIITKNIFTYTSNAFQITNRLNVYALVVIIQRAVYAVIIVALLLMRNNDYYWYCIADLVGDLFGILLGVIIARDLYVGRPIPLREGIKEFKTNAFSGCFVTVAGFAGAFLIIGSKSVIQWKWDTLTFGKLAFSFSVCLAFVSFINAFSVVLFPSIKRMDESKLPDLYGKLRGSFTLMALGMLIGYYPCRWILEIWLPKYAVGLVYLGTLLPLIIFYMRLNFLTNNYLKAYRKEKAMLFINVGAVVFGMGLFLLCAYGLDNLNLLLYSVVLVIMLRSVVSEIVIGRRIGQHFWKEYVEEMLMSAGFIACVQVFSLWIGCAVYAGLFVVYVLFHRESMKAIWRMVRGVFHKEVKDV